MSGAPLLHALALGAAILLTSAAHVLLRSGAARGKTVVASVMNARTFAGYGVFLLVTLLIVIAMQRIPLSTVVAWSSVTYILTLLAARLFLEEQIRPRMWAGAGLIAVGIAVYSW